MLLRSIGEFINEITGSGRPPETFAETDFRLASAALLVHAATSDNRFDETERTKLRDILAYRFKLGMEEVDRLIDAAIAADREAVDLYQFTTVLNRAFDEEGRRRVVEMMFEIAYADGELSEFEDNLVWRAADLMHVPSRDRVAIRKQVRDQRASGET
jgi:uncharacterized tellurite resistance protein B-like protein